jgi:hypothetical protein
MGPPPGLVEHQEPGVSVELLERLDPGVHRLQLGREHKRGRPRFHQATMVAKIAATTAAMPWTVLIQSIMPGTRPRGAPSASRPGTASGGCPAGREVVGDADHHGDQPLLACRLLIAHDPLGRHHQLPAPRDDRDLVRQQAGAGEAAAMAAPRVLEDCSVGIVHRGRALADNATVVEQAEQAAAGERTLQSAGERSRDRLAHRHTRQVGEDAVGKTAELQLAGTDEADQRVFCTREGVRECALGGGRRVVALSHVVLQEPAGPVGPRLARAQRAVVRVFHRTGVGREIDRARCQ